MINFKMGVSVLPIILKVLINEELNQKQNKFNKIPNSASFNKFDYLLI